MTHMTAVTRMQSFLLPFCLWTFSQFPVRQYRKSSQFSNKWVKFNSNTLKYLLNSDNFHWVCFICSSFKLHNNNNKKILPALKYFIFIFIVFIYIFKITFYMSDAQAFIHIYFNTLKYINRNVSHCWKGEVFNQFCDGQLKENFMDWQHTWKAWEYVNSWTNSTMWLNLTDLTQWLVTLFWQKPMKPKGVSLPSSAPLHPWRCFFLFCAGTYHYSSAWSFCHMAA